MPFSLATYILCHSNREQEAAGRGGVRAAGPPSEEKGLSPPRETGLKICQPRREGGTMPTASLSGRGSPPLPETGSKARVGKQEWFGGGW